MLLSLPNNVFSRILERRILPIVKLRIQGEQCGFCPVHRTLAQLHTLNHVLEGSWKYAQLSQMCFVDVDKAFDRVPGILWGVLQDYGVCGIL